MQVDSCFGSRLVSSAGLIHFTDGLEEISPYKFVNVSARLVFAFKLSSGAQQSNFTYVTEKIETLMKSKFQLH